MKTPSNCSSVRFFGLGEEEDVRKCGEEFGGEEKVKVVETNVTQCDGAALCEKEVQALQCGLAFEINFRWIEMKWVVSWMHERERERSSYPVAKSRDGCTENSDFSWKDVSRLDPRGATQGLEEELQNNIHRHLTHRTQSWKLVVCEHTRLETISTV